MNISGKRLAVSYLDFITINPPYGYEVKVGMKYWIWSHRKKELQEYKITEYTEYSYIEKYVKEKELYIEE